MDRKIVIISGGTSGIGLATADILVKDGFTPVLLGRDGAKGAAAVEKVPGSFYVSADVTDRDSVEQAVKKAAEMGSVVGVVASAGCYMEGLLEEVSDEDMEALFSVNVYGTIRLARACLPYLKKGTGAMVIVSSDVALHGNVQCSLYGATKGAVTAFARSLALELAVDGVRVNVVCPGDVDTPLLEEQLETYGGAREEMDEWYPLMRIATPEEVGHVIVFLLSSKASFMTGAVVPVDGGLTDR